MMKGRGRYGNLRDADRLGDPPKPTRRQTAFGSSNDSQREKPDNKQHTEEPPNEVFQARMRPPPRIPPKSLPSFSAMPRQTDTSPVGLKVPSPGYSNAPATMPPNAANHKKRTANESSRLINPIEQDDDEENDEELYHTQTSITAQQKPEGPPPRILPPLPISEREKDDGIGNHTATSMNTLSSSSSASKRPEPGRPSTESGLAPKATLYTWLNRPPLRLSASADSYVTWNNGGRPHEAKYAAIFVHPTTGECFLSERFGEHISSNNANNSCQITGDKEETKMAWFGTKKLAEHGAAARAYDCLIYRDYVQNAGSKSTPPDARLGEYEPYVEPRILPASHAIKLPNEALESILRAKKNATGKDIVLAQEQDQTPPPKEPTLKSDAEVPMQYRTSTGRGQWQPPQERHYDSFESQQQNTRPYDNPYNQAYVERSSQPGFGGHFRGNSARNTSFSPPPAPPRFPNQPPNQDRYFNSPIRQPPRNQDGFFNRQPGPPLQASNDRYAPPPYRQSNYQNPYQQSNQNPPQRRDQNPYPHHQNHGQPPPRHDFQQGHRRNNWGSQ